MPDSLAITEDLTCAQCRYDLRSLPADSNCPECGRAILESINLRPLLGWIPGLRRGVIFLAIAMLALQPHVDYWFYQEYLRISGYLRIRSNPDETMYLHHVLLLIPAAWLMSRRCPFLQKDPHRFRKWLILLTSFQVLVSLLAYCIHNFHFLGYYWGSFVLMLIYAFNPLAFTIELWLIFESLFRHLPLLRHPPPRMLFRALQWSLICTLLINALFDAMVSFARLRYIINEPPDHSFLGKSLTRFLTTYLVYPAQDVGLYLSFTFLLLVVYCLYRVVRTPRLPDTFKSTTCSLSF